MALRKDVRERVEWLRTLFAPYMNKPVTIEFGAIKWEGMILTEVDNQPVTGFKLAPDKRKSLDNKTYSPTLIKVVFNGEDKLVFVDEDTVWAAITNGVRARVGSNVVTIRAEG